MSAHAGIFNRSGSPIEIAKIEARLAVRNAEHGPDRAGRYADASVSMFHWARWFDRLSRREQQPCRLPTGVALTFDGRLDNRTDLVRRLGDVLPHGVESPDADIVGAAYARWGTESLGLFDGDWSLVVVDARRRTLVLARDYVGARPLYYYVDETTTVLWSTCFAPLVDCLRHKSMDEEYLVACLTSVPLPAQTVFRDIRQVEPGAYVAFDGNANRVIGRHTDLRNALRIRPRTTADYAEGLHHYLREGVAARLRTDAPVGVKLSGGYDSSAVTCLAHRLIADGAVEAPALQPVTYINSSAPEGDERRYVAHVEKACGISSILLPHDSENALRTIHQMLDPFRRAPHSTGLEEIFSPLGVRVVLTGEMGDLVMAKGSSHCGAILENARAGNLIGFFRDLALFAEVRQVPLYAALARVLEAYYPLWLVKAKEHRRLRQVVSEVYKGPERDWPGLFALSRDFLKGQPPVREDGIRYAQGVPSSKRWFVRRLYEIGGMSVLVSPEGAVSHTVTHPFLHRPLVQYTVGMPQRVLWRPYPMRALMKQALRSVLPHAILMRDSKGDATPGAARRVRALVGHLGVDPSTWSLVTRGWVQPSILEARLLKVMTGVVSRETYLERLCYLEAWLRRLDGDTRSRRSVSHVTSSGSPTMIFRDDRWTAETCSVPDGKNSTRKEVKAS